MTEKTFIKQTASLTPDDILNAHNAGLEACRVFGESIDAKTIDLRLWAAAAIYNSCVNISVPESIEKSFQEKLKFMAGIEKVGVINERTFPNEA